LPVDPGWAAERGALEERIAKAGIRYLPFPFNSSVAINSDTDTTSAVTYRLYNRQIVDQYGLDFGDSCWLHQNLGVRPGLGFFTSDFRYDDGREALGLSLFEMLQEYHEGNFDLWHSFLARGPRVAILKHCDSHPATNSLRFPSPKRVKGDAYFGIMGFNILAVGVFGDHEGIACIEKVVVTSAGASTAFKIEQECPAPIRNTPDGEAFAFFPLQLDPASMSGPPLLWTLDFVDVVPRAGARLRPNMVRRVYLYNVHSELLLDRVRFLYEDCNLSMNLITAHSQWHLKARGRLRQLTQMSAERFAAMPDVRESYFGSHDDGELRFSTQIDEPWSFGRMFPELATKYGIRHVRMTENYYSDDKHPTVENGLLACRTGMGDVLSFINSTNSRNPEWYHSDDERMFRKSIATNLHLRLRTLLDDLRQQARKVVFLTTHMGNIEPLMEPPTPYFGEEPLFELSRRHYGMDVGGAQGQRIWFTKSSGLADYLMLIAQLPDHVERRAGETIISSWHDPFYEAKFPAGRRQLYGQTFYVADSSVERVRLDGAEIDDVGRNAVDETGRPSVTVLECPIKRPVLGYLQGVPAATFGTASWNWMEPAEDAPEGLSYGRLAAPRGEPSHETSGVRLHCGSLRPLSGGQVFAFWLRVSDAHLRWAVSLQLQSGEEFLFHEASKLPFVSRPPSVIGYYELANAAFDRHGWRRMVVPLFDLTYLRSPATHLDLRLPTHPLAAISIIVQDKADAYLELAGMEFGRPRTTVPVAGEGSHVIGIHTGLPQGTAIQLHRLHGAPGKVDERTVMPGAFTVFNGLNKGAYRISTADHDPRHSIEIDLRADRFDLAL
jgi:hypothetical protein